MDGASEADDVAEEVCLCDLGEVCGELGARELVERGRGCLELAAAALVLFEIDARKVRGVVEKERGLEDWAVVCGAAALHEGLDV